MRGHKSELAQDLFFDGGRQVREGADGAGKFPHAHGLGGFLKSTPLADHLVVPEREFQAECCRFGMNAVRAADGDRGFEFLRALLQHLKQAVDAGCDDRGCFADLKRHGRIEHIRRCQAEVKVSG